ncbi:MAG: MFS transporter [Legionellales bacterium]|nr:MFS transporter [Legionellales bacterium]
MLTRDLTATAKSPSNMGLLPIIIFGLALLFDFFGFMLQVVPSVMGNSLVNELKLNALSLSAITGCFFYAYAAMQIPVGVLLDRIGPRRLMTAALLTCSVGATLFAVSHHAIFLSIGEILMGMSAAFAYVSVLFLAVRWFPPASFSLLVGITELTGALGAMVGQTPLLYVINHMGWRDTMFGFSLIGLILSVFVLLIVRDKPASIGARHVRRISQHPLRQLKKILRKNQIWIIGLVALLLWAPVISFGSLWGVPFLQVHYGISATLVTSLTTLMWLGTAVGAPLIGWLSMRLRRRQIPLIVYSILGAFSISALLYMPDLNPVLIGIFLFCFGLSGSGTCLSFALIQDHIPQKQIGTAMGFNNMMVVVGGPVCQLLIGLILQQSFSGEMHHGVPVYSSEDYQLAMLILPVSFLVAALVSLIYLKPTYCQKVFRHKQNK